MIATPFFAVAVVAARNVSSKNPWSHFKAVCLSNETCYYVIIVYLRCKESMPGEDKQYYQSYYQLTINNQFKDITLLFYIILWFLDTDPIAASSFKHFYNFYSKLLWRNN